MSGSSMSPPSRSAVQVRPVTDDQIRLLAQIARAAGDHEMVAVCELALRDWPKARTALLREIAFGKHEAAFREAVLAAGEVRR